MFIIFSKRKTKFYMFPPVKVLKSGIKFYSTLRHRLKIFDAKIMQIDNVVYLKKDGKQVIIKNIKNVYCKQQYLYFDTLGEVLIVCDLSEIYRYFNIKIISTQFDLELIKKQAMQEILDNIFLKNTSKLNRYIKIIKDIFNVKIRNDCIFISQNRYLIPFKLIYRLNNTVKIINVN